MLLNLASHALKIAQHMLQLHVGLAELYSMLLLL
jgi:hypothetical protein